MKIKIIFGFLIIAIFTTLSLGMLMVKTIPAGHVGVGSVFGKVQSESYPEGMHIVSPVTKMTHFDARQKTHKESMGVPSRDQMITNFDISIQYRLIKEKAPNMLKETGTPAEVINVHMVPFLRSQLRELGKSVNRAEEFYDQTVQQRIQNELVTSLSQTLSVKGIKIEKLLIRDIVLPRIITDAVARKKKAAQEAEKEKEDLKRFKVQQERKEAQAQAEKKAELIQAQKQKEVMIISANARLEAARIEAQKQKEVLIIAANAKLEAARIEAQATIVRADAEAAAKKKIVDVVTLSGYVKLESMKELKNLQRGNHLIIMDPNKANPLPFLNLNDPKMRGGQK